MNEMQRPKSPGKIKACWLPILLILSILASSCSFTLPSREESAELGRRGFFRSGSPAWASSSGRPVTYAGGAIVTETKMEVGGEASKLAYQEPKELFEPEVQTTELQSEKPEDMLSQIEFDCEGTERSVNKAITTVSPSERVKQYRGLLRACPNSGELWYLLADSLVAAGKSDQATEALKSSIRISPDFGPAIELQNSLK